MKAEALTPVERELVRRRRWIALLALLAALLVFGAMQLRAALSACGQPAGSTYGELPVAPTPYGVASARCGAPSPT
jgi:hypothetical protein